MANFPIYLIKADGTPDTGKTVLLRTQPAGTPDITLTESGSTGVYGGGVTVADGLYKLYIGGVEQTSYGTFWIGDDALAYVKTTTDETVAGVKTFSSSPIVPTATTGYQAVAYNQAGILSGDNTWTGDNDFTAAGATCTVRTPTTATMIANKDYVDDQVSAITTPQQTDNLTRVLMEGYEVSKYIYTTLAGAHAFANSVASSIRIMTVQIEGVNTVSNLSPHTVWTDYVWLKGLNQKYPVTLANVSATVTKETSGFDNLTLAIGNFGGSTTTTLNGFRFENCLIKYDGTLNLTNCVFGGGVRIKVLSDGGTLTLTNCEGSTFVTNTSPVKSGTCPSWTVEDNL